MVKRKTATSKKRIELANKNTGKGIKYSVASRLSLDDCLQNIEPLKKEMRTIESDCHIFYSYNMENIT